MTAMVTMDGKYRVEAYQPRGSKTPWFRLVGPEGIREHLAIATVESLLRDAGYAFADLRDVAA
ncbi:hypothetical protein AB0M54_45895 [Actinoplanes sp. NPDC051470]|uniref:hypothetical protein n=1 Tax=Actinoplanes sp. NPDC051470 TaxID=3157224 RepID=UPI0034440849